MSYFSRVPDRSPLTMTRCRIFVFRWNYIVGRLFRTNIIRYYVCVARQIRCKTHTIGANSFRREKHITILLSLFTYATRALTNIGNRLLVPIHNNLKSPLANVFDHVNPYIVSCVSFYDHV